LPDNDPDHGLEPVETSGNPKHRVSCSHRTEQLVIGDGSPLAQRGLVHAEESATPLDDRRDVTVDWPADLDRDTASVGPNTDDAGVAALSEGSVVGPVVDGLGARNAALSQVPEEL